MLPPASGFKSPTVYLRIYTKLNSRISQFSCQLLSQIRLSLNLTYCGMWSVIKTELKTECTLKLYFVDTVSCVFTILIY